MTAETTGANDTCLAEVVVEEAGGDGVDELFDRVRVVVDEEVLFFNLLNRRSISSKIEMSTSSD